MLCRCIKKGLKREQNYQPYTAQASKEDKEIEQSKSNPLSNQKVDPVQQQIIMIQMMIASMQQLAQTVSIM